MLRVSAGTRTASSPGLSSSSPPCRHWWFQEQSCKGDLLILTFVTSASTGMFGQNPTWRWSRGAPLCGRVRQWEGVGEEEEEVEEEEEDAGEHVTWAGSAHLCCYATGTSNVKRVSYM